MSAQEFYTLPSVAEVTLKPLQRRLAGTVGNQNLLPKNAEGCTLQQSQWQCSIAVTTQQLHDASQVDVANLMSQKLIIEHLERVANIEIRKLLQFDSSIIPLGSWSAQKRAETTIETESSLGLSWRDESESLQRKKPRVPKLPTERAKLGLA